MESKLSGILPSSSLVPVRSPLCLEQGALCETDDSLTFVLDGENTHIYKHTKCNFSLCPQQIKSTVLSLYQEFQINLHLGPLSVTEAWADTALSTSVGGQTERKQS